MLDHLEKTEKRSHKGGEKRHIENDDEIETSEKKLKESLVNVKKKKKFKKKKNKNDGLLQKAKEVDSQSNEQEAKEDTNIEQCNKKTVSKKKLKRENSNVGQSTEEEAKEDDNSEEEVKKKGPSKRQLKKEKAEKRAVEAKEASKHENSLKALNYVSKWKHAKSQWKFEKLKQVWLIDNFLDKKYVPEDNFEVVLEYFESCKGAARKQLIEKAMAIVKKIEDNVEEDAEIVETTEYKRARQLMQALPTET